ncbi:MAG: hypothetical protein GY701_02610 [Sulfitobacter sp.]|nr:hypothetical protein [Sulfitobacter sp.]
MPEIGDWVSLNPSDGRLHLVRAEGGPAVRTVCGERGQHWPTPYPTPPKCEACRLWTLPGLYKPGVPIELIGRGRDD